MDTDYSCGVIPVVFDGAVRRYLLVQHHAGHGSFPKGHPETGETAEAAARRELAEETGLREVELLRSPMFEERYAFTKRSGKVVQKDVTNFLGRVARPGTVVVQEKELADFAWGGGEALELYYGGGLPGWRAGPLDAACCGLMSVAACTARQASAQRRCQSFDVVGPAGVVVEGRAGQAGVVWWVKPREGSA